MSTGGLLRLGTLDALPDKAQAAWLPGHLLVADSGVGVLVKDTYPSPHLFLLPAVE